jgi:exopolysaccharide biosynthesis polyprenyl glycosylphosphotransferase
VGRTEEILGLGEASPQGSQVDLLIIDEQREKVVAPGTALRYRNLAVLVALTDILSLVAAIIFTWVIRSPSAGGFRNPVAWLVVAPAVWVGIFALFRLYSLSQLPATQEFRRVLMATGLALVIFLAYRLVTRPEADVIYRGWALATWTVALLLVLATRQAWHRHMGRLRKGGRLCWRTLIVGANQEAVKIAESLQRRTTGFTPVGLVRTDHGQASWDGVPTIGDLDDLSRLIDAYGVECVFVASSAVGPEQMAQITRHLGRSDVEIRVSANMTNILSSRLTVEPVGNLLALSLRPVRLSGLEAAAKRAFDLSVAGVALVLAAPVWLVLALLITLTSRGPVLYRQQRVGRGGRPFTMFKFRTMVRGADLLLAQLADRNEASGPMFKVRNDPRVTPVGRWLRQWSLDELPQLLNVLIGDMSLVGPRPPLPNEVEKYEEWHRDRLQVRPGLTGVWQVGGRSDLGFDDYVRLDLFYIENWSIPYDLFIIAKTIPAVLFHKGAY